MLFRSQYVRLLWRSSADQCRMNDIWNKLQRGSPVLWSLSRMYCRSYMSQLPDSRQDAVLLSFLSPLYFHLRLFFSNTKLPASQRQLIYYNIASSSAQVLIFGIFRKPDFLNHVLAKRIVNAHSRPVKSNNFFISSMSRDGFRFHISIE